MNDRGNADNGGRKISTKAIVIGVVAVLLVIFAVLNTDDAQVNWILGTWETSLIVVILLSGVLGFVIGWLVRGRRSDG
jgi:uncharacterized integral membrane protein